MRPIVDRSPDRDRVVGVALILGAACLYGSGPFFARVAYDAGMSPLPLLTWRYVFAALVGWLLVTSSLNGRRSLLALTRQGMLVLVVLGLLYAVNAGAFTAALETVPASLVAILVYIYPAIVAVLSMRYARRLEGRRPWAALAISMTGVALAVGGIPAGAHIPVVGLALAVGCAVSYAVWIVLAARMRGERPDGDRSSAETVAATGPEDAGTSVRSPDALASSAIMSTTTAVAAAMVVAALGGDPAPGAVPGDAWPALMGFGACSGIAVVSFLAGTRRIGAARAALVSTFEPVYTIVLATLLLGEHLSPIQILGGTLVVSGVLIAETGRPRRSARDDQGTSEADTSDTVERATV